MVELVLASYLHLLIRLLEVLGWLSGLELLCGQLVVLMMLGCEWGTFLCLRQLRFAPSWSWMSPSSDMS